MIVELPHNYLFMITVQQLIQTTLVETLLYNSYYIYYYYYYYHSLSYSCIINQNNGVTVVKIFETTTVLT